MNFLLALCFFVGILISISVFITGVIWLSVLVGYLRCEHELHTTSVVRGAGCDTLGNICRVFDFTKKCRKCIYTKTDKSMTVPGDKRCNPQFYALDGWPIDACGKRLEIAG